MDKLIALIPTILFIVIVLYQMIRGFMRGKRKSIYLLINMTIAMVITLILFLSFTFSMKNVDILTTVPELEDKLEGVVSFVVGDKAVDVLWAYISMFTNLIVLIVLLLFVYPFVKAVAYVVYLIGFRRRVKEDKEDGEMKRVSGMLIGGLRGLVVGFLVFSQFSTLYYVVAGGVFYTSAEYDNLDITLGDIEGIDLDDIYKGIKTSRSSGLGLVFEKLSIGDNSLDYLFLDMVVSSSYENYKDDKTKITIREEIGNLVGIAATLYQHKVITFEGGKPTPHLENLSEEVLATLLNSVKNTKLFVDGIPTVMIDFAVQNAEQFGITLTEDMINNLDVENDVDVVASILVSFMGMIEFDFETGFKDIDWYGLDAEIVDTLLESLSSLTLLTEVMLPLGVGFAQEIIQDLTFDLTSIVWKEEIQNLKGLYSLLQDLELENGFKTNVEELEKLLEDEDKVAIIDDIVAQVFRSDLIFKLSVSGIELMVKELGGENELVSELNIDTTNYSKEDLQNDVKIIMGSAVGGYKIFKDFTNEDPTIGGFTNIDAKKLEIIFLGERNGNTIVEKGFMDLNFLDKCLDEDVLYRMVIEQATGGVVEIPAGLIWRNEFQALFDVVVTIQDSGVDIDALISGDIAALGEMSDESIDTLTDSICDSKIITALFVGTLTNEESGLSFLEIPTGIDWYGDGANDGEIKKLLTSIFHIVKMDDIIEDVQNGDISKVLSKITTEDLNTLLNSEVLTATFSVQLETLASDGSFIVIPAEAKNEQGYVTKEEIINLFDIIKANEIDDITQININDLKILSDANVNAFTKSIIMSRTLVNELTTLEELKSIISIPSGLTNTDWYAEDGELIKLLTSLQTIFGKDATINDMTEFDINDIFTNAEVVFESSVIRFTVSESLSVIDEIKVPTSSTETKFGETMIKVSELISLVNAFESLGLDISDLDLDNLFGDTVDYDTAFTSNILRATMSYYIISMDGLIVPTTVVDSEGYITKDELVLLFEGFNALGIASTDGVDFESILNGNADIATSLESKILHATFSSIVLNTLNVPKTYYKNETTEVTLITTVGGKDMVNVDEIVNLLNAVKVLGLNDVEAVGSIDFNILASLSEKQRNAILDSYILSAQISSILIDASNPVLEFNKTHTVTEYEGDNMDIIHTAQLQTYLNQLSSVA